MAKQVIKEHLMAYNDIMKQYKNHKLKHIDTTVGRDSIYQGVDDGECMTVIVYDPDNIVDAEIKLHDLFAQADAIEHISIDGKCIY